MSGLGPMPRPPRKFHRDFAKHGHHELCPFQDGGVCTCRGLDQGEYEHACEAKYDSWKNGDYTDRD